MVTLTEVPYFHKKKQKMTLKQMHLNTELAHLSTAPWDNSIARQFFWLQDFKTIRKKV